jgi:ABC-2 type transport system ATP-binding protein
MSNIIEVNQLVKWYPGSDRPAVHDVSFAVQRGEIFGLLGPAGAGKTTMLAMLAGMLKPDGGTATIAGFDLIHQPTDIKRHIRLVPQQLRLFPLLSIQEHLLWYGRVHGLHCAQLNQRVGEALKVTQLHTGRHERADRQTCGTRYRISLAAALLHRPEILLLDEPTLSVDQPSRDGILQIVAELNRRGLTIVYATRDGAEAARLCQRVALIDRGRIVALDTPRALQEMLDGNLAVREKLDAVFLELTGKYGQV